MATVPDIESTDLHRGAIWRLRYGLSLLGESWPAVVGLTLVVFWVLVAILAPVIAPYDPNANDYIRIMEKRSGLELDWYKEYFVNTTHSPDYAAYAHRIIHLVDGHVVTENLYGRQHV